MKPQTESRSKTLRVSDLQKGLSWWLSLGWHARGSRFDREGNGVADQRGGPGRFGRVKPRATIKKRLDKRAVFLVISE